jgi:hypothetical protein
LAQLIRNYTADSCVYFTQIASFPAAVPDVYLVALAGEV